MTVRGETEASTRAELIDPLLIAAGWGENGSRVRRGVIVLDASNQAVAQHPSALLAIFCDERGFTDGNIIAPAW